MMISKGKIYCRISECAYSWTDIFTELQLLIYAKPNMVNAKPNMVHADLYSTELGLEKHCIIAHERHCHDLVNNANDHS